MTRVYVVHHVHQMIDGSEDVKLIGVYSTEEKAQHAIGRLRSVAGFRDTPEGFEISGYDLDQNCWSEGFVTMP